MHPRRSLSARGFALVSALLLAALFSLPGLPPLAAQAPPGGGASSQEEAMGEAYTEGTTYAGGARIALDSDGHTLSVEAGTGRMADFGEAPLFVVLATVSGPNARWSFSYGKETSGLTLLVDGKRYAPVEAQFAATIVSPVDPATKPERTRRRTDGETVVNDTTEHPLAIVFRLPGKALRAPGKTLSLRGFEIAGRSYALDLKF